MNDILGKIGDLKKKYIRGDGALWRIYLLLCVFSIVSVYSSSSALSYKTGVFWMPFFKQMVVIIIALIITFLVQLIPWRIFKAIPIVGLPLCFFLLLFTLFFGKSTNSASRWVDLGVLNFQPSELTKLVLVASVALVLSRMQSAEGASHNAMKYILWIVLPFLAFIVPENLSTALLIGGVIFLMMFIGRVPLLQLFKIVAICTVSGVCFLCVLVFVPHDMMKKISSAPGMHRMLTWQGRILDQKKTKPLNPNDFDVDENGQRAHANIAIMSSHLIGKGPGNSVERDFLSMAYCDFIFAIIIEEYGIVGAIFLILLYISLLYKSWKISLKCNRNYPAFLILGCALMIVSQAIFNMLIAVGLFPVSGQTLPMVSRGGSSAIITACFFGLIISISEFANSPQNLKMKSPKNPFNGTDEVETISCDYEEENCLAASETIDAEDNNE